MTSSAPPNRDDVTASDALWPDTRALLPPDAVKTIATLAAQGDVTGRLSDASLDALRQARYFGAPVPKELQGGGATILECCALQRQLGEADPALAIALNMHLFSAGTAVEHWLRARDNSSVLLEEIATRQGIIASAFAEPGLGGSLLRSNCLARATEGGYLVTGTKTPCSLAARADVICLQVQQEEPGPQALLVAALPSCALGVRVERTWNTLGMRASESDTLYLENCFIPHDFVFHRCEPGFAVDEVFAAGLGWFCLTTTATYLGVVRAALDTVRAVLHTSSIPYLKAARAELPSFQSLFGELVAEALVMESACVGVAALFDRRDRDPRGLLPLAIALKHTAVEICTRAVADACELAGAQSYSRNGILERLWRDVQGARFHPPTRPASRQILGRWALGLPFTFELSEWSGGPQPPGFETVNRP
jgi:alkylation response protein AidB-like acyl-CoA dehydrogenase